jgi:hypothetical protein
MKNKPFQSPTETQESDQNVQSEDQTQEKNNRSYPKPQVRLGLALTMVGYFMFLLGARPSLFGLDRSRVIGFVQISVFLVGLGIIALGSYLTLNTLWPPGTKTIAADIGSRLISTGYVICVFTAMADIFGLGSHRLPNVFFGPLQARGVAIGMATIAIGFLLLIRYKHPEDEDKPPNKVKEHDKKEDTPPHQGLNTIQAG